MPEDSKNAENNLSRAAEEAAVSPGEQLSHEDIEGGLRTYSTDIADMMKREKGSIIKIALAEQERREAFKQKHDPTATKNIVVMMLGFILIVGGIMIFIYSIVNRARPAEVTNFSPSLPSFVFTENQVHIDMTDLNRTELIDTIHTQVANETLVTDTINNLFVSNKMGNVQTQTPSTVFLQKLGINVPDTLFQNLQPTFMLGIYNEDGPNELFMIFRVKDFNDTFLAMREWELTMLTELVRLFDIDTSPYGRAIFSQNFVTETLFNKEARLLKDKDGKVLLSYIFLDPKTVMITTQGASVEEILKRINLQTLK